MTTSEQDQRILADLETQFLPSGRFGIRLAVLTTMFALGLAFVVIGFHTIEPVAVVMLAACGGYVLMTVAVLTATELIRGHRSSHPRGSRPPSGT